MEAFGETRPLFDTADGVPERMNRFVMIMIEPAPQPEPPLPQSPPPSGG